MRVALCFCTTKTPGRAAPAPIGSGVRSADRLRRYSSNNLDISAARLSSTPHEATRYGDHFLRAGFHPGEAVLGHGIVGGDLVQHAAREVRWSGQAAVHLPARRQRGGPARGKQYLVQIRPLPEGGLVMQNLMYNDEIRPFSEVGVEPAEVKDQELALARQIIEQISTDEFKPEKYKDDVRTRIQEQIQRKVEGQEIQIEQPAAPQTQIIDLMEALKASLAAKGLAPARESAPAPAATDERKPAKRAAREAKAEK